MSDEGEARVHYFQGQFLRPQDFADEQAYHLAHHRRHNIAHHRWGIVAGLDLVVDAQDGALVVEPGVAVDGLGRELVLPERQPIAAEVFADKGSDLLDVYLNYSRSGADAPRRDYPGSAGRCEDAFDRWTERPLLSFEVGDDPSADRRDPPGVRESDRGFDASRTPPDEPQRRWPVFLGSVAYDRERPRQPFTVDPAGRPYAGLVGASVVAPSGRASVQIGAERRGDPNRFAVFVPEADASPLPGQPRVAILEDGAVRVLGDTTLHGNLTVDGHALELEAGTSHPAGAHPSQLYHVTEGGKDELRIEMAVPGGGGPDAVVIGTWSEGTFHPCLTVANDCTVTVHGNLVVEGTVAPAAFLDASAVSVVDPGLGDEAERLAVASFASGVSGAAARFADAYRSPFPRPPVVPAGSPILLPVAPEAALQAAATTVATAPDRLEVFVGALASRYPQVAEQLREALGESEHEGGP
jgi:hypothetical protein